MSELSSAQSELSKIKETLASLSRAETSAKDELAEAMTTVEDLEVEVEELRRYETEAGQKLATLVAEREEDQKAIEELMQKARDTAEELTAKQKELEGLQVIPPSYDPSLLPPPLYVSISACVCLCDYRPSPTHRSIKHHSFETNPSGYHPPPIHSSIKHHSRSIIAIQEAQQEQHSKFRNLLRLGALVLGVLLLCVILLPLPLQLLSPFSDQRSRLTPTELLGQWTYAARVSDAAHWSQHQHQQHEQEYEQQYRGTGQAKHRNQKPKSGGAEKGLSGECEVHANEQLESHLASLESLKRDHAKKLVELRTHCDTQLKGATMEAEKDKEVGEL